MRRGSPAVIAVGALAMAFAVVYWLGDHSGGGTRVHRVLGTAYVDGAADAIGLEETPPGFFGSGFEVTGAYGRECLVPGGDGQPVELGVVHVQPEDDAFGSDVVIWVKCLGPPKHFRPSDAMIELTEEQRRDLRARLPRPGTIVEYSRNEPYLGSRSETAGIPDVQPGQRGRVLVLRYPIWIVVAWEGGPTLAMLPDSVREIG
jgi:hypothetical protein